MRRIVLNIYKWYSKNMVELAEKSSWVRFIAAPVSMITFSILFTSTLLVNKYVLSELNFTYPTIFQGWQTMVGAVVLNGLSKCQVMNIQLVRPCRREVALWMPGMLFFVFSIYSGSVALANLSVPIFLTTQTLLEVARNITSSPVLTKESVIYFYISNMVLTVSVIAVALTDPQYSHQGYTWLSLHILSNGALEIYAKFIDARLKLGALQRLNMNYIYSVIVLAPSCYFLGDALAARRYPYLYFMKFYVGCLLSGIFGALLSLSSFTLPSLQTAGQLDTDLCILLTKVAAMVVSLYVFPLQLVTSHFTWIIINILASVMCHYSHRTSPRDSRLDVDEES